MAEGLRRAAAAAKATRTARCPECGKAVTLRVQAVKARIPVHGPLGNRRQGSGKTPAKEG